MAERIRHLKEHGGGRQYYHDEVGYNFRCDTLQAAALLERLGHLLEWNAARWEGASDYERLFREHGLDEQLVLPERCPGHVFHQYVIRSPERDALREGLSSAGIAVPCTTPCPCTSSPASPGWAASAATCRVASRRRRRVLALPIHPGVTARDRAEVVATIADQSPALRKPTASR